MRLLIIEDGRAEDIAVKNMFNMLYSRDLLTHEEGEKTKVVLLSMGFSLNKEIISDIESEIRKADIIVFDYGGLYFPGGGMDKFLDYWNRLFVKWVEDKPSKRWICYSKLETFEDDDIEKLQGIGVLFPFKEIIKESK